jgi:hypothetical protein
MPRLFSILGAGVMSSRIPRLCAILALWLVAVSASAGELPQTFTSQYRPAVERLRQAYSNLTAEGIVSITLPRDEKSSEQSFVMRAGGEQRRLDLRTLAQQGMGLKVGTSLMRMATPAGSLSTETGPQSQFFDDAQETNYDKTVAAIDRGCLLNYPYALDSQTTILDMLRGPAVKVTGIKWVRAEGQPLVQINYVQQATHAGRSGKWNSTLLLSPSDGWALRSFSRTIGEGSNALGQSGRLQYSSGPEGIPLVQAISVETSEGGRPIRSQSVQVSKIDLGAPDSESFTSFAF